jgi:hypothetical protein
MKVNRRSVFVTIAVIVWLSGSALAQGGRGARRLYDPNTETTVKGTLEKVLQVTGRRGWNGTHVVLRTDDQSYDVHVGPSDYLASIGLKLSAGDQIEVTGSKIKLGDAETIIAREIKDSGKAFTLRDSQGVPKWSAGGRRFN